MLLVYLSRVTRRSTYTLDLIFRELVGIDYKITTSAEEFLSYQGERVNYSAKAFDEELFFAAHSLLFENGIKNQEVKVIDFEDTIGLFPVYDKKSIFPFDPFAATFYLVTRYEEYFPFIKDNYGRYIANQCIAHQNNFLQKPVVNQWALKIRKRLFDFFPGIKFKTKKYSFIPTYDVDAAWSYRQKGFVRTIGGYLRSLADRNYEEMMLRTKVLLGLADDPFDTFSWQFELQKKYFLCPIYFILFAEYGLNDKNIPVNNVKFRHLLKILGDYAEVGIHPSFGSNFQRKKLEQEVSDLSFVLKREIVKSRQHFLMLSFPTTYRNLINLDITDDYTMGYASQPGFRAGIADTFYFYDLDADAATRLRVHPFAFMEGTLADYLKLSKEDALANMKALVDEVKKVDGTFISLWHNESLSDQQHWAGWRTVYEEMVRYALA